VGANLERLIIYKWKRAVTFVQTIENESVIHFVFRSQSVGNDVEATLPTSIAQWAKDARLR
jgi:hypothetical protein